MLVKNEWTQLTQDSRLMGEVQVDLEGGRTLTLTCLFILESLIEMVKVLTDMEKVYDRVNISK